LAKHFVNAVLDQKWVARAGSSLRGTVFVLSPNHTHTKRPKIESVNLNEQPRAFEYADFLLLEGVEIYTMCTLAF
jgi:hypothetical protein